MSALYGLRWSDIETMPKGELDEYRVQFNEVRQLFGGMRARGN